MTERYHRACKLLLSFTLRNVTRLVLRWAGALLVQDESPSCPFVWSCVTISVGQIDIIIN